MSRPPATPYPWAKAAADLTAGAATGLLIAGAVLAGGWLLFWAIVAADALLALAGGPGPVLIASAITGAAIGTKAGGSA